MEVIDLTSVIYMSIYSLYMLSYQSDSNYGKTKKSMEHQGYAKFKLSSSSLNSMDDACSCWCDPVAVVTVYVTCSDTTNIYSTRNNNNLFEAFFSLCVCVKCPCVCDHFHPQYFLHLLYFLFISRGCLVILHVPYATYIG